MIADMFELMYAANGVGLAANQVDLPFKLFVVNAAGKKGEGEELVFINPVLSKPKGSEEAEEGCLSLPELYGNVTRPKQVEVHAFDLSGNEVRATLTGMPARIIQHEFDHLEGVLFTDRMSETGRMSVQPTLQLFEEEFDSRRSRGEVPPDGEIVDRLKRLEAKYC